MVSLDARLDVARSRALVTMPLTDARRLVEHEAELLCERRLRRQPTSRTGRMHRCQGCNVFMGSRLGVCSHCGYRQDVGWTRGA
jgi:hypothetical protein